jgi:hypothetical protein
MAMGLAVVQDIRADIPAVMSGYPDVHQDVAGREETAGAGPLDTVRPATSLIRHRLSSDYASEMP